MLEKIEQYLNGQRLKTPNTSNPNNITRNTIIIRTIFIANFISFQRTTTTMIPIRNKNHRGISKFSKLKLLNNIVI